MLDSPDVGLKLDATKQAILGAFGDFVKAMYVMGSITREATDTSDLDVAVVFADDYYNEHIDEMLPRFAEFAAHINAAHPRHPLALWASKVDHYKTFFPDVSYVRRNLPRDQDRLDAWSGLAKHTLISYETQSAHLIHGDFDIGARKLKRLPSSEAIELFLLSTRTLAEGLFELSASSPQVRHSGINHLAKAGLRAVYAVAIREEGALLASYRNIADWGRQHFSSPCAQTIDQLYAIKTGALLPEAPPVAPVIDLMRHCERRIADAPRLKLGGLTKARAGESFSFRPSDLTRQSDPVDQYSRFAGLETNYVHAMYFLLTSRAIVDRLTRMNADDAVLDFFFEELSILATYALFNPSGVRIVVGRRERDVFVLKVDLGFLKALVRCLSQLVGSEPPPGAPDADTPWLTREVRAARLRVLLSQAAAISALEVTADIKAAPEDIVNGLEWQGQVMTGLGSPRVVSVFNKFGLTLYQSGLVDEARRVLGMPLRMLERREQFFAEMGLNDAARQAFDREFSKTRQYQAITFHRQGDHDAARREYRAALALDPDNYSALDDLTALLISTDPSQESIDLLTQLLDSVKLTRAESQRQVATRLMTHAIDVKQRGQFEEAEIWYRRSMKVDPSFEKPPYNLGFLYEQMGKASEAEDLYRLSIQTSPQYALPYVRLGLMLEEHDVAAAEQLLREGVEAGASSEHLFANLGNCQLTLEKYEDAFASYQKALEVNDQHADAWNGLGMVLLTAGDTASPETLVEAAEYFRRAYEADPSFEGARDNYLDARARLAAL